MGVEAESEQLDRSVRWAQTKTHHTWRYDHTSLVVTMTPRMTLGDEELVEEDMLRWIL